MKRFLIKYTYDPASGSEADWHGHVAQFISNLQSDPELGTRIKYRCMKVKDTKAYYHLAEPLDENAAKELGTRDWFKRYTDETKRVAGGTLEVLTLETFAETH